MSAAPIQNSYGEKIYEGKAKILYRAPDGTILHYFKDSATAFNAQKKADFEGKGELNLRISSLIFEYLKSKGVQNHLLKVIDARTFQSPALKMIPAEVVVRNLVAGSLSKRLQVADGVALLEPTVEFYLKDDAKGDPLVSEDLMVSLYGQKRETLKKMASIALDVNKALKPLFEKADLTLVDFKLEFGANEKGEVILADEISPDTCRLWDKKSGERLDKDRFRLDLGDLLVGYRDVLKRLEKATGRSSDTV